MFTHWEVNRAKLASRVLFQRPAYYVPEQTLQQHVRERVFPDRKLRKRAPDIDIAAFDATCNEIRRLAAINEAENPVSFAIGNSWNDTLRADKRHHLEYTHTESDITLFLPSPLPSWVAPLVSPHCLFGLTFVPVLAPLVRSVGPFLLRSGPIIGSSYFRLVPLLVNVVHLGLLGHWCICP